MADKSHACRLRRRLLGPQHLRWDGRDAQGQLLPPGLYLLEVALQSDEISDRLLRPLGIAY